MTPGSLFMNPGSICCFRIASITLMVLRNKKILLYENLEAGVKSKFLMVIETVFFDVLKTEYRVWYTLVRFNSSHHTGLFYWWLVVTSFWCFLSVFMFFLCLLYLSFEMHWRNVLLSLSRIAQLIHILI